MLLSFTDRGIYCPRADVYIDPWRPVSRALLTHGHSDHARSGHQHYLCTHLAAPVVRQRLGADLRLQSVGYGETVYVNGVEISFWPAGHIIGSAQIRLSYRGETWVVSGDYKLEDDGLSTPFEPVRCQHFVTESTFGLPIYRWQPQAEVFADINAWWRHNQANGITSILTAYALGKAQRLLCGLDTSIGPIFTHGAIEAVNATLRNQGIELPPTELVGVDDSRRNWSDGLVLAPPAAAGSPWLRRFKQTSLGMASGWMTLRGARRRRAADRGFVLSDHADWPGLNTAIQATGASHIYVTHGYTEVFQRWLSSQGYDAHVLKTEYAGDLAELDPQPESSPTDSPA